jgi:hypothetical protein
MDADVDMDMDMSKRQQRAVGSPRIRRESELFSKRPPTSPMLLDTPRKPRPPARPLGRATPRSTARSKSKSGRDGGSEEEKDDPLALSFSSPDVVALSSLQSKEPTTAAAAPAAGGGKKKKRRSPSRETHLESRDPVHDSASARSGSTNPARRRPTLDEELRQAHAQSLLHENGEEPDLDSGTLVGVGTRSKKKGFLAHGGAGGVPVFMGDGYVDGVEVGDGEEVVDGGGDRDDDSDYSPKSKKGAGGGGRKRAPTAAVGKRKGRR